MTQFSGAVVSTWSLLIRRPQRACRQAEMDVELLGKLNCEPWSVLKMSGLP
jgi:hypothetical protein